MATNSRTAKDAPVKGKDAKDFYADQVPAALNSPQVSDARLGKGVPIAPIKENTAQLVQQGRLPDTRVDERTHAIRVLENSHPNIQEKLKKVAKLADLGETSVTLVDKNGIQRECRVEMEKIGNPGKEKTLIHLFATDERGKEHVILRGIKTENGDFEQQRDRNGNKVSYIGNWWTTHMNNVSKIGGVEDPDTAYRGGDSTQAAAGQQARAPQETAMMAPRNPQEAPQPPQAPAEPRMMAPANPQEAPQPPAPPEMPRPPIPPVAAGPEVPQHPALPPTGEVPLVVNAPQGAADSRGIGHRADAVVDGQQRPQVAGDNHGRHGHHDGRNDGHDGRDERHVDRKARMILDLLQRYGVRRFMEGVTQIAGQYRTRGTGYFPYNDSMEGGFFDKKGYRLRTLEDWLAGRADYVSVAMDGRVKYGTRVRIPELNRDLAGGREIPFRVVDTGSAFRGRGTSRIDICRGNRRLTHDGAINRNLTLQFLKKGRPSYDQPVV